jgi:hypothetical protein
MPHITTRSDLDDRCRCGHVRGEHLRPSGGGWHTAYCLIFGCHCGQFQDDSWDDDSGGPSRNDQPTVRGKKAA